MYFCEENVFVCDCLPWKAINPSLAAKQMCCFWRRGLRCFPEKKKICPNFGQYHFLLRNILIFGSWTSFQRLGQIMNWKAYKVIWYQEVTSIFVYCVGYFGFCQIQRIFLDSAQVEARKKMSHEQSSLQRAALQCTSFRTGNPEQQTTSSQFWGKVKEKT